MIDYYLLPFLIAESIAIALAQEQKDIIEEFEEKLVFTINDLMLVIIVLSQNGGKLSENNKNKLKERIENEWDISKIMNPRNSNIRLCEDYIRLLYA